MHIIFIINNIFHPTETESEVVLWTAETLIPTTVQETLVTQLLNTNNATIPKFAVSLHILIYSLNQQEIHS